MAMKIVLSTLCHTGFSMLCHTGFSMLCHTGLSSFAPLRMTTKAQDDNEGEG